MIAYVVTPPAVPMIRADWLFCTASVETWNDALVEPLGTVTSAGTVAAAVLSLDSATTVPPVGAADGDAAWIHGGSPTLGFLKFGADGPFNGFYHSVAGTALADAGFMFGLLAIGVSLTLGIFSRLGTVAGVVMYVMMWTVVMPPANNPITDDHVIGAAAVLVLGLFGAGRYLGLGHWWEKRELVQKYPVLK